VHRDNVRYIIGVAFAVMVFACGFYALVPYEFELDDLVKGAMISLMTLSAQFVFGEALANAVGRRAQQSFEAGSKSASSPAVEEPTVVEPPIIRP
jgi:ABC-type uncharacterized transport system permease subunit